MAAPGPRPVLVARQEATEVDDATLARSAMAGDAGAHTAIWDRFHPMVRRVLRRTMGPSSDVEDQVQEVFLRFYRNRTQLRNPEALRSFLFGISVRVAASELRSRRIRGWLRLTPNGVLEDYALPHPSAPPHADTDAREAVKRLYAILDRLDTKSRLAFVLHHVEGLELIEIANALGVSLATVKRRLQRVSARVWAMAQGDRVLIDYLDAREPASLEKVR
jgi:RNA polymerase sigma-70 factor (ECF subfamily)